MGVTVQLLHSEHRMAVFSAMMVGTVAGVAVLGTTIVSLARRSNNSQNPPRRQRASVTEFRKMTPRISHRPNLNDFVMRNKRQTLLKFNFLSFVLGKVLNVDMVDRGLCFTATNIDCSLDMDLQETSGVESDQVLAPPCGFISVFS